MDGAVEERNLGERDHSWIQGNLVSVSSTPLPRDWHCCAAGVAFQIKPTRFRIPDVVVTLGKPEEQILTKPPLLCIEILSPEDTVSRVNQRVQEYLAFGVPLVWVIDPADKRIWIYRPNGMEEAQGGSVALDGTSIVIPFSEIFD